MDTDAEPRGQSGVETEGPIALGESDPSFLAKLGRRVREAREQRGMARKVLSRTAASQAAGPLGWRYLLGTLNASVPVSSP